MNNNIFSHLKKLLETAHQDVEQGKFSRRDFNRWLFSLSVSSGLSLAFLNNAQASVASHMRQGRRPDYYFEDFAPYSLGTLPASQFVADFYGLPSVVTSAGAISGKGVRLTVNYQTTIPIRHNPYRSGDFEILILALTPANAGNYFGAIFRSGGAVNQNHQIVVSDFSGTPSLIFGQFWSNSYTELKKITVTRPTANTRYYLRARLVGSLLSVRYWKVGTAEPGTWTMTDTDANYASRAGYLACHGSSNTTAGYIPTYEWMGWSYNGTTVPVPV